MNSGIFQIIRLDFSAFLIFDLSHLNLFYVVILRKSFKNQTSFTYFDFQNNNVFAYFLHRAKLFINNKYFYEINHLIITNKIIMKWFKTSRKQYCFPENEEMVTAEVYIAISKKKRSKKNESDKFLNPVGFTFKPQKNRAIADSVSIFNPKILILKS